MAFIWLHDLAAGDICFHLDTGNLSVVRSQRAPGRAGVGSSGLYEYGT